MADEPNLLDLTADIVAAHVGSNSVPSSELPALISSVYGALNGLGKGNKEEPGIPFPLKETGAVSVRKSLADPNVIISMIDGKPYTALKRHLKSNGMTPADYREKYGLKADYPMTAPAYSAKRSEMAKAIGLGTLRKKATKAATKVAKAAKKVDEVVTPKQRGRKPSGLGGALSAAKKHLKGD